MTFTTIFKLTLVVIDILSASPASATDTTTASPVTSTTTPNPNLEIARALNDNYKKFNTNVCEIIDRNTKLMDVKSKEQKAFSRFLMKDLKKDVESKVATRIADSRKAVTKIESGLKTSIQNSALGAESTLREYVEKKMAEATRQLKATLQKTTKKLHDSFNTTCPAGWSELPNKCIRLEPKIFRKWARANEICLDKGKGGKLVEINNRIENAYVTELVQDRWSGCVWIGLTKASKRSKWLLSGGQSITYSRWRPDEPNEHVYPNCGCIGWDESDGWSDQACNNNYKFICQIDKVPK